MQYKLIKTYPNCGIYVGYKVALFGDEYKALVANGQRMYFSKTEVENYPEFWEKVLEEEKLCVPIGTKFKTNLGNNKLYNIYKIEGYMVWVNWERVGKGVNYTLGEVNKFFKKGVWIVYPQIETKEEIMQRCIKMFPKGSLVRSPENGEVYRVANEFTKPGKNDWFEGVYYYGMNNDILAIKEGKGTGFYLYCEGKYGELVQEETKQEYEILEFKRTDGKGGWGNNSAKLNKKDGKYYINEGTSFTLYSMLNSIVSVSSGDFYISKIRRLSDNEEFSIGDKVKISKLKHIDGSFTIDKFYFDFNNNKLLCNGSNTGNGNVSITKIEKVKKEKIFTTEDGIDIFEGDECFAVSNNFDLLFTAFVPKDYQKQNIIKTFSTKEKAEEYIMLNKKQFSLQDIIDVNSEKFVEGEMYKKLLNKIK